MPPIWWRRFIFVPAFHLACSNGANRVVLGFLDDHGGLGHGALLPTFPLLAARANPAHAFAGPLVDAVAPCLAADRAISGAGNVDVDDPARAEDGLDVKAGSSDCLVARLAHGVVAGLELLLSLDFRAANFGTVTAQGDPAQVIGRAAGLLERGLVGDALPAVPVADDAIVT
ncbi:hypothetical protein DFJ74DRAFT_655318 [Hyaloraphidium curvatum]|nr:hypothetical protein DFJ74DRAFT_655318 [Hyaloraphidium curvatum]